jgi:hypothetical protein
MPVAWRAHALRDMCPEPHDDDDGVSPCHFGPTCRSGHAKRVLPIDKKERQAFWTNFNANGVRVGARASDRNASLLRAQLEPWSTMVLRKRLQTDFSYGSDEATPIDALGRAELMQAILDRHALGGKFARRMIRVKGTPVPQALCEEILAELRQWAAGHQQNDRPSISAESYTILRSPAEFASKDSNAAVKAARKIEKNQRIWDLGMQAMRSVDADFAEKFTALAITGNFNGSPHIDSQNTGPFYGLAVGTFPEGQGGVMVETDTFTVAHVNTRCRLGRIDGRFPHWVAPYDAGTERYSLIFYQTDGAYLTPAQAIFAKPEPDEPEVMPCSPAATSEAPTER